MSLGQPLSLPTEQAPAVLALSLPEFIEAKALDYGVAPELALEIAFCESSLRQFDARTGKALRGIHNPDDVGLFQINGRFHLEKSQKLGFDIYTSEGNVEYAMWLLANEGARHWRWSQNCWR